MRLPPALPLWLIAACAISAVAGEEPEWGPVADGLRCRAWIDNSTIRPGGGLEAHYELQNVGDHDLDVLKEYYVEVEWIGLPPIDDHFRHRWKPHFIREDRFVTLAPGEMHRAKTRAGHRVHEIAEGTRHEAQFRVAYLSHSMVTKKRPSAWGPAPGADAEKRLRSNLVTVDVKPYLPGHWSDRYRIHPISSSDAWLVADIVAVGRITRTSPARRSDIPRYREDTEPVDPQYAETQQYKNHAFRLKLMHAAFAYDGDLLQIERVLKGDSPNQELSVHYVARAGYERALSEGARIGAFITRTFIEGETGYRIFQVVPPDALSAAPAEVARMDKAPWGTPVNGLKCRLLAPDKPVASASHVPLVLDLKYDPETAFPSIVWLDRRRELCTPEFELRKRESGEIRKFSPSNTGRFSCWDQDRVSLVFDPLRPIRSTIWLTRDNGLQLGAGTYDVRVRYTKEPGWLGKHDEHGWRREAWTGTVTSEWERIECIASSNELVEIEVPTKIVAFRGGSQLGVGVSNIATRTIQYELPPEWIFLTIRETSYLIDGEWVRRGTGTGGIRRVGEKNVCRAGSGISGLRPFPRNREAMRLSVHVRLYATQYGGYGWGGGGPGDRLVFEETFETDVPSARTPDAPTGEWGDVTWDLQSRLVLDKKSCQTNEGVTIFLDVRNAGTQTNHILRGDFDHHVRIFGPKGRVRPRDPDPMQGEINVYTAALAPQEMWIALFMNTSARYRFTEPGEYRVEWKGALLRTDKEGYAPPAAPSVSFTVLLRRDGD